MVVAAAGAVLVAGAASSAHAAFAPPNLPAESRSGRYGGSGIASIGGRDQGRVRLRFIVDRLADFGAMNARPRDAEHGGSWSARVGQRLYADRDTFARQRRRRPFGLVSSLWRPV
jgi:hypothetical protein